MSRTVIIVIAIVLFLHGLVHLMGTAVYMRLATIETFAYKTTLLAGQLEIGKGGMKLFGALWLIAAAGFVVSAMSLLLGWSSTHQIVLGVTLFSLILTVLDWDVAYAGIIVNIILLIGTLLVPRIVE